MTVQKESFPMSQAQQGRIESALPEWHNLATKADVAELRARLEYMATKENLAELRGEFSGPRVSLRTAGWFAGMVVGLLVALVQIGLFFLQRSLP